MSINSVALSGNIVRDAELRSSASGTSVLSFTVCVDSRTKGKDGQWTTSPNWVECTMFGPRAQKIAASLKKGTMVFLKGWLRYSSWEKDGVKKHKLGVVADDIEFVKAGRTAAAEPEEPDLDVYDDCVGF